MVRQNEMIYNALYVSFAANKRGYAVEKIDAQNRIDPLHEDNKRSRLRVKVSPFLWSLANKICSITLGSEEGLKR